MDFAIPICTVFIPQSIEYRFRFDYDPDHDPKFKNLEVSIKKNIATHQYVCLRDKIANQKERKKTRKLTIDLLLSTLPE